MRILKRHLCLLCILSLVLSVLAACSANRPSGMVNTPVPPIEESYEYTVKNSALHRRPAFVQTFPHQESLTVRLEDGMFVCITTESAVADDFINAQRTLLRFLRDRGAEVRSLQYYAVDYDDSFSDSGEGKAYIALSSTKSYRQVLVTLQALWGDYTEYGYVYAMANAIAGQLGWQTDPISPIEQTSMDDFFSKNPAAIHLLYPSFTAKYASEETVKNCKALSTKLFEKMDWSAALALPVEEQLEQYYALVGGYAKEIAVPFTRQTCGYAYYGADLPLRILTTYAQMFVDNDYLDINEEIYGDYFSHYDSIYETANIINREITAAVERFGLENQVGVISMEWLSGDTAAKKFGKRLANYCDPREQKIYLTTIQGYLHEYHHHIEILLNPDRAPGGPLFWQSQAFCEIGRSHSYHAQYDLHHLFTDNGKWEDLFYACAGHANEMGENDFFEAYDIFCYVTGYYELDYYNGRDGLNSFNRYLIERYGEDVVCDIMLFPETVSDVTGKTWEELEAEWVGHIRNKYAGVDIPDWVYEYFA